LLIFMPKKAFIADGVLSPSHLPISFFFILKCMTYFVINEEKSQISYITIYDISHHQNDTQFLCQYLH
jgi:hypothetical protein